MHDGLFCTSLRTPTTADFVEYDCITLTCCLNYSTKSYLGVSVFEFERAFKQQYPHLLLTTAGHWARQVQLAEVAHQLQVTSSAQRSSIEDVYVEGAR